MPPAVSSACTEPIVPKKNERPRSIGASPPSAIMLPSTPHLVHPDKAGRHRRTGLLHDHGQLADAEMMRPPTQSLPYSRTVQVQVPAPDWRRPANPRRSIGRSASASRTPDGAAARSATPILDPGRSTPRADRYGLAGRGMWGLDERRYPTPARLRGPPTPAHTACHHTL